MTYLSISLRSWSQLLCDQKAFHFLEEFGTFFYDQKSWQVEFFMAFLKFSGMKKQMAVEFFKNLSRILIAKGALICGILYFFFHMILLTYFSYIQKDVITSLFRWDKPYWGGNNWGLTNVSENLGKAAVLPALPFITPLIHRLGFAQIFCILLYDFSHILFLSHKVI